MDMAPQFLTVKQAAQRFPAFSENAFRLMMHKNKPGRFNVCVIRLGRRVLIDEEKFIEVIRSYGSISQAVIEFNADHQDTGAACS